MASRLTAADLLDFWERGLTNPLLKCVLDLLVIAYPELSFEQWKESPIGQRDRHLLDVREALFGSRLNCLTTCPKCSERLELGFEVAQLHAIPLNSQLQEKYLISIDDCEVQFRLPNSSDLLQISNLADVMLARRSLFERCVLQATRAGNPISIDDISEEVSNAIATRMAELDPQADMQILLTCPTCLCQWSTGFDIASFLWVEINAWASRILNEVHRLASAYGWSEAEILTLTPMRRQLYLDMIG
jgi:hypothetical protein